MPDLVSFDIAYEQLMQRWEDPHLTGKVTVDGGGKTRYGISQHAYPSIDIDTLTADNAKKIAYTDYWATSIWDVPNLDSAYQSLANKLFQFGFNAGVGRVVQITNMCLFIAGQLKEVPKLGDHLSVTKTAEVINMGLVEMLAASQLSLYIADYRILAKVPHSLLDRALCID
jgi:hypothetical protein